MSKNTAHVEPFSVVLVDSAHGKEMDYLIRAQGCEYFSPLRLDLEKSMYAFYVVSLLDRVVQVADIDTRLYDGLYTWLSFLAQDENINIAIIDCFVVFLLHCLGFSISEKKDISANQKQLFIDMEGAWWTSVVPSAIEYEKTVHTTIYNFLCFHTEKFHADWAKTCVF